MATNAPLLNALSKDTSSSSSDLVPLRVDVTSDDGTIRVIDTLLFDPKCWPIPLYAPLEVAVERNVQEMAHSLLADMDVYGMGRTTRHFTGRVDLWSPALQARVAQQLRSQLWSLVETNEKRTVGSMIKIHLRLSIHGILVQDDLDWDLSVPQCPIAFAKELAKDLNLPEEATTAIATSILEQLHGIQVDEKDMSKAATALLIDPREQVTNVAHLVVMHRPATLDPGLAS